VLTAAALLVVGCSDAGSRHASATTTVSPSRAVNNLGPCPKQDPNVDVARANAGVVGLNRRLVPVPSTAVRVCDYLYSSGDTPTRLLASGLLGRSGSEALEAATNTLPLQSPGPGDCPGPETPADLVSHIFLLSFVDASRQVDVYAVNGRCGSGPSNGTLNAGLTTTWLNDLHRYTALDHYARTKPTG
jgi:hypothetical protein